MGVGLFTGIETFSWTLNDFDKLAQFAQSNGVSQVVIKIYEITQGEWYGALGGPDVVMSRLTSVGLDVLPYGFFYGNDVETETKQILSYLGKYGKFCANMETSFNNAPTRAEAFLTALKNHPGDLYVSTWANPVTQGWQQNIATLDPIVKVWMPEAYSDSLVKEMYAQFPKVQGMIWPTFEIVNTPVADASIYQNFTVWEYQEALKYPNLLREFVNSAKGIDVSHYPTNSRGMVLNLAPNGISEFQPGHTEFACGAFSVAITNAGTPITKANTTDPTNTIKWAEAEYAKTAGDNSPSNTVGASIADMHTYLKDTQSDGGGLHWWDTSISTTSEQNHDIATIKAALEHGYPVIATVSEASVFDLDLGRNPYWWGPSGNHIFIYVGIASDGNLLVADPANVVKGDGNLQTPKTTQSWPRKYDINKLDNQWATIIKTPWLPPIINGDPLSWPPYAPPAPQPAQTTVLFDEVGKQLMFVVNNQVVYRINV